MIEPVEGNQSLKRSLSVVIGILVLIVGIPAVGVLVLLFLSIPSIPTEGACGLNYAITDGNTELAQKLIAEGFGTVPCLGPSAGPLDYPIHVATRHGRLQLLQRLLEVGADPNSRSRFGETPLNLYAVCSENEHIKCLKCLIRAGADVNSVDNSGYSALHGVAAGGYVDTAEFLLKSGADINHAAKDGITPLHAAARSSFEEGTKVVPLLLEHGADTTLKDEDGKRPIDLAIAAKNNEIVRILKKFEADRANPAVPDDKGEDLQ